MISIALRFFALLLLLAPLYSQELLLLSNFDAERIAKDPQNYLWSEKLDGVRAYWDGKALYSRGGKRIEAPSFFTQGFPPFAIDGELWSKRGDFERIVSITRSKSKAQDWKELKLYVFEVPNQKGGLLARLKVLSDFLSSNPTPYITLIPQHSFKNTQELHAKLSELTKLGAEGLVVRNKNTPYNTGRSKEAMKLKSYQDRECRIIEYLKGQGKFKDKVGSILCQDGNQTIKIGSGMDEEFRKNPPPLDTIITYKFFGLTQNGKPRFPTFLRIRRDIELQYSSTMQAK